MNGGFISYPTSSSKSLSVTAPGSGVGVPTSGAGAYDDLFRAIASRAMRGPQKSDYQRKMEDLALKQKQLQLTAMRPKATSVPYWQVQKEREADELASSYDIMKLKDRNDMFLRALSDPTRPR